MAKVEQLPSLALAALVALFLGSAMPGHSAETVFPVEQSASPEFPDKTLKPQKALISTSLSVFAQSRAIELFNGTNFTGWVFQFRTNADPALTWTVTNGVIHCTGQPYGYMRTEQAYRDYKLTVEWRFVKTAPRADNTGIFLHVQQPDKVWPQTIECQGQSGRQGDILPLGGTSFKVNGESKTSRSPMRGQSNEKPVGEWNTYEIVCLGDTLKASVNGRLLNEATDCSVSSGFIAIQSEGGEFEVRRVTLERLSPQ